MRKILDNIVWIVLFIFLVPSGLAAASWNSLPGSLLFQTKLAMQQALVVIVSPSVETKSNLQVVFTEQRFSEAKQLLAESASAEGLSYLNTQVVETKQSIVEAKDPVVRKQLAKKYIASLRTMSTELKTQRQLLAASRPTGSTTVQANTGGDQVVAVVRQPQVVYQTNITNVTKTIVVVATATPTPTPIPTPTIEPTAEEGIPTGEETDQAIDESEITIEETIAELEGVAGGTDEGSDQGNPGGMSGAASVGNDEGNNGNSNGFDFGGKDQNRDGNGRDGDNRDNN